MTDRPRRRSPAAPTQRSSRFHSAAHGFVLPCEPCVRCMADAGVRCSCLRRNRARRVRGQRKNLNARFIGWQSDPVGLPDSPRRALAGTMASRSGDYLTSEISRGGPGRPALATGNSRVVQFGMPCGPPGLLDAGRRRATWPRAPWRRSSSSASRPRRRPGASLGTHAGARTTPLLVWIYWWGEIRL